MFQDVPSQARDPQVSTDMFVDARSIHSLQVLSAPLRRISSDVPVQRPSQRGIPRPPYFLVRSDQECLKQIIQPYAALSGRRMNSWEIAG